MYINMTTFYDYAYNVLNTQQPYVAAINFNFNSDGPTIETADFSITELAASPEVARYFYGGLILNTENGYYDLDFNNITEHF